LLEKIQDGGDLKPALYIYSAHLIKNVKYVRK